MRNPQETLKGTFFFDFSKVPKSIGNCSGCALYAKKVFSFLNFAQKNREIWSKGAALGDEESLRNP